LSVSQTIGVECAPDSGSRLGLCSTYAMPSCSCRPSAPCSTKGNKIQMREGAESRHAASALLAVTQHQRQLGVAQIREFPLDELRAFSCRERPDLLDQHADREPLLSAHLVNVKLPKPTTIMLFLKERESRVAGAALPPTS